MKLKRTVIGKDAGFLALIPFSPLSASADLVFDWNTTIAFSSAGHMTAWATVLSEFLKLGKDGDLTVMVGGVLFTEAWLLLLVTAQRRLDSF